MPNSRLRCKNCDKYKPREEFVRPGYCSEKCLTESRSVVKKKSVKKPTRTTKRRKPIPPEVQAIVRERDGWRCRWCGTPRSLASHHCAYRSQGGPDEPWNLIVLCNDHCHLLAHSDKRRFQPLLQGVLWLEYFYGIHLTVPQYERWLEEVSSEKVQAAA